MLQPEKFQMGEITSFQHGWYYLVLDGSKKQTWCRRHSLVIIGDKDDVTLGFPAQAQPTRQAVPAAEAITEKEEVPYVGKKRGRPPNPPKEERVESEEEGGEEEGEERRKFQKDRDDGGGKAAHKESKEKDEGAGRKRESGIGGEKGPKGIFRDDAQGHRRVQGRTKRRPRRSGGSGSNLKSRTGTRGRRGRTKRRNARARKLRPLCHRKTGMLWRPFASLRCSTGTRAGEARIRHTSFSEKPPSLEKPYKKANAAQEKSADAGGYGSNARNFARGGHLRPYRLPTCTRRVLGLVAYPSSGQ
ncbi:hypothetical protein T484DRAFT_1911771 [Baffinella frigidus]|nr:hypothetical protein T484DRAFT_1911771 [Cryptophyta sp. CCMP2293]